MASGRINGRCTGGSASKYSFWVDWSSSPVNGKNASLVSATAYVKRNDGYAGSAYNLNIPTNSKKITVAGKTAFSSSKGIDTRNGKTVVISSISGVLVNHNSNGYATINISSSFPRVASSLTGGSLSGNVSLDHIDQKPPVLTSFKAYATSTSEIVTEWTADCEIGAKYYSVGYGWKLYDGKKITGLSPNTNYNVAILLEKAGTNLKVESPWLWIKTFPILVQSIGLQDMNLNVGQSTAILKNVQPSNASIKKLEYKMSPEGICEIKEGAIKALKEGIIRLTATTTDGSNITESATITCTQRVGGLFVPQHEITVPVGDVVTLRYWVVPRNATDQRVTLTSDSPNISLSGNEVTGIANGEAEIFLKTVDGDFTDTILINVSGSHKWYDYSEYIDILNYWDVRNIMSNMRTVYALLIEKGYPVEALENVIANYDTPIIEMFDLLQKMEYNLDKLNNNDLKSVYYIKPKAVGNTAEDKADIWRWIQCLNDQYGVLTGKHGLWGTLLCTDGYPTINGERLLVRGEIIA